MSTNPIMATIIISIIANYCVNSSDCSSTTTILVVVRVSINIRLITNYCGGLMLITVLLLPSFSLLVLGFILLLLHVLLVLLS